MHTPQAKIRRSSVFGHLVLPTAVLVLLAVMPAWAEPPRGYPTIGKIDRVDPAFDTLIPKDAVIEVIASGFDWSEGPLWIKDPAYANASNAPGATGPWLAGDPLHPPKRKPNDDGFLIFSDTERNMIFRWRRGEDVGVFMKPSGYTGVLPYSNEPGSNGLAIDAEGRITFCEHGDRRVSRLEKVGGKRTLVDNYQGKRLNSPNDLVYHSSGALYFTDPLFGLPAEFRDELRELDFCGVYRLGVDGQLTLLTKELSAPNGIAFSADEKTLYVANCDRKKPVVMAYEVNKDGSVGNGRVFFDPTPWFHWNRPGRLDGLKTDAAGHVFASGPGGIFVFSSDGKHLGTLNTGEATSNCGWGNDGSVLYLTADAYVCRVKTTTKGAGW